MYFIVTCIRLLPLCMMLTRQAMGIATQRLQCRNALYHATLAIVLTNRDCSFNDLIMT